jgi:hypothetical protein
LLLQYPEDPSVISQADKEFFYLSYIAQPVLSKIPAINSLVYPNNLFRGSRLVTLF